MEAAENRLESILCSPTIHIEELKRELSSGNYTNEEINIAAWRYVEFCVFDCFDINTEYPSRKEGEMIEGRPSCHLYEVMEILLGFGMDPNYIYDDCGTEDNIMDQLQYISNGYLAADTAALLLEHGGDPNLVVDGNTPAGDMAHDLAVDMAYRMWRHGFDEYVHYWMVLLGYGALDRDGGEIVQKRTGFDISALKNHREYTFGIIYPKESDGILDLCLIDKKTHLEVARF